MAKTIEEKLNEGRAYRDIASVNIEIREDENEKIVEGYATTFDEPYELFRMDNYIVREQVSADAFVGCDFSDVIMQYNHEGRVFARTGNGTLALDTDEHGLHIRADLSGTELGRQVYDEIRGGYTDKMSFGFHVAEDEHEEREDPVTGNIDILRTIKKIDRLFDVSAVSIPANDATVISARAYSEGVIADAAREACERAEERKRRDRQKQRIRILTEVM